MDIFLHSETWIALLTLTFLEIVLGVDNIIFISIVSNKLPEEQQRKTRNLGLILAMAFRVVLLLGISFIMKFQQTLFELPDVAFIAMSEEARAISGRDLILFLGGLFLMAKSTTEIFHKMEGKEQQASELRKGSSMASVIMQIIFLDIIFSFDSILTAIGLTDQVILMIIAVIISIAIMMIFAGAISRFINKYPSLQLLALSFLILIGFMLMLEGFAKEIPKGYIYFAVFFSLMVELINIRFRKKQNVA